MGEYAAKELNGLSVITNGHGFGTAILAAGVSVAVLGGVVERFILRRLAGNALSQVLATLGVAFVIADFALWFWGGDPRPVSAPDFLSGSVRMFGLVFPLYRLSMLVFSILRHPVPAHGHHPGDPATRAVREDSGMKRTGLIALLAVLACLPALGMGDYYIKLASQILIAALFALSLNLLVGYAGLTSLGHAGYLGLAGYVSGWLFLNLQWGHLGSAAAALGVSTMMAALFGMVALRATGLSGLTRPAPFGLDLGSASVFYYFALAVFLAVWGLIAIWVRSPFGASIQGTRDQPRRMSALGYNVWLIRWITFIVSGFFGAVAGLMYVCYHQFISPHSLSLANSAEMLLMVIAGGPGTLAGPVVGAALVLVLKNVASAYIDRRIMLLGFVFIFIFMFVPGGIVPGMRRLMLRLRKRQSAPAVELARPLKKAPSRNRDGDGAGAGSAAARRAAGRPVV